MPRKERYNRIGIKNLDGSMNLIFFNRRKKGKNYALKNSVNFIGYDADKNKYFTPIFKRK